MGECVTCHFNARVYMKIVYRSPFLLLFSRTYTLLSGPGFSFEYRAQEAMIALVYLW